MFESVWSTFQSLLRHLKSDTDPPLLTGYVIHTQNPGFLGDRGYVINSQKSRILERGYLIEGGGIILNWVVTGDFPMLLF